MERPGHVPDGEDERGLAGGVRRRGRCHLAAPLERQHGEPRPVLVARLDVVGQHLQAVDRGHPGRRDRRGAGSRPSAIIRAAPAVLYVVMTCQSRLRRNSSAWARAWAWLYTRSMSSRDWPARATRASRTGTLTSPTILTPAS